MSLIELPKETLILVALADELAGVDLPLPVVLTGVGKLNAAYAAITAIRTHNPLMILNYGTAGAVHDAMSGLVECGAAIERDMNLTGLGLPYGQTFGDPDDMTLIRWGNGPIIGTGDNFAQEKPPVPCDLVDMEAYAIARICRKENIRFGAVKYVSDQADAGAADDWHREKSRGGVLFYDWLMARL